MNIERPYFACFCKAARYLEVFIFGGEQHPRIGKKSGQPEGWMHRTNETGQTPRFDNPVKNNTTKAQAQDSAAETWKVLSGMRFQSSVSIPLQVCNSIS